MPVTHCHQDLFAWRLLSLTPFLEPISKGTTWHRRVAEMAGVEPAISGTKSHQRIQLRVHFRSAGYSTEPTMDFAAQLDAVFHLPGSPVEH